MKGFYDKVGKIVVFVFVIIIIIGVLAYVGFITPDKTSENITPQVSAEEQELIQDWKQIGIEMGHYNVYLSEEKFDEAKSSILAVKLRLSDMEVKLGYSNATDKKDLTLMVNAYKPLLDALSLTVDVKKLDKQRDVLTWDKYNLYVKQYIEARNKYAEFYNQANLIQDEDLKKSMNLSAYDLAIKTMDSELKTLQSENMTQMVYTNTYISKINPLNNNVRSISASIEQQYGTTRDKRLSGVINYFSENLNYVHIPNWNPNSNIQYIQTPDVTLTQKGGNCADLSILFSSMAESIGVPTMFCFADTTHTLAEIQKNPELFNSTHAVIQYEDDTNAWYTLDPTCYAGVDVSTGDKCNRDNNYVIQCHNVEEFKKALDVS